MEASATSAVESTSATVEPTTAARREAATASISAAGVVADRTVSIVAAAAVVAASAVVPSAAIEATATVESATIATEPWAGANEDAANEPIRSVVAVWRAGVWGIAVVTIGASRSPVSVAVTGVSRSAKTNANRHSLGVRISRAKQANRNQQTSNSSNPEVSHLRTPFRVRNFLIPDHPAGRNRNPNSRPHSVKL